MADEDEEKDDDQEKDPPDEGSEDSSQHGEEHHGMEEEIEEILRQQGEEPGKAQRPTSSPWQGMQLPRLPGFVGFVTRYAIYIAIGAGLLFLSFRVLGPLAFRFAIMAIFVFLLFYTLRGIVQDIILRRRNR